MSKNYTLVVCLTGALKDNRRRAVDHRGKSGDSRKIFSKRQREPTGGGWGLGEFDQRRQGLTLKLEDKPW